MFEIILNISLVITSIALLLALVRAIDTLGMMLVAIIGMVMLLHETVVYADIALVVAIIGFVGTITMAKFIEKGDIIDDN